MDEIHERYASKQKANYPRCKAPIELEYLVSRPRNNFLRLHCGCIKYGTFLFWAGEEEGGGFGRAIRDRGKYIRNKVVIVCDGS